MLKLTKRARKKEASRRTVYYISGCHEGHRVRESLGTDNREEAGRRFEARRKEIITALGAGHSGRLRFAEAVAEYLNDQEKDRDPRFLDAIVAEYGEVLVSDIDAARAKEMAIKLYPQGCAATRNRQVITPASAVINFAAERKLCSPVRLKRFVAGKRVRKKAVDWEWSDKFRAGATSLGADWHRIGAMQMFMMTTAARLEDCEKLLGSHLNLDEGHATLLDTKTGDDGIAILPKEMVRELRKLTVQPDEHVFGVRARRQLYKRWRTICEAAEIEYVPPHQAGRHTFATEMIIRRGIDPVTTANVGRWKSTKLLLDVYAHPEKKRKVVEDVFDRHKTPSLKIISGHDTISDATDGKIYKTKGKSNT